MAFFVTSPAGLLRKENMATHLEGTMGVEDILVDQDKIVSQSKLHRDFFHMYHEGCIQTRSFKACIYGMSVNFWLIYTNFRACVLSPLFLFSQFLEDSRWSKNTSWI